MLAIVSPFEWLFGLLVIAGLGLMILGHRILRQGLQRFGTLPSLQADVVDRQPVYVPTSVDILGLLVALLAAWLICGLLLPLLLNQTGWPARRIESISLIAQSLGFQAIGMALIVENLRKTGFNWRLRLDPRPVTLNIGRSSMAYLMLMPVLFLVSAANQTVLSLWDYPLSLQEVVEIFRALQHPGLKGLLIFSIVALAPVFEELLFRGLLFPWLAGRLGWMGGALVSSLFFASIHFHLPSAVPLAALGIALCLLYALTGRLILCMLVHLLFNSVNLFAVSIWAD